MPGARYRTLSGPPTHGGDAIDVVGGLGNIHYNGFTQYAKYMNDVAGYPDLDNPLELTIVDYYMGSVTGQNGFAYRDENIPVLLNTYIFGDVYAGLPSDNSLFSNALAKTSPFHANWNGSSAVGQLKDFRKLPQQVRDIGDAILNRRKPTSLLKAGADWNLLLAFGINPFIQDLKSLLDFQDRCDKRVDDFGRMTEPGGGKRKATVWKHDTPEYFSHRGYFVDHYQANAQYNAYYRSKIQSWGSVVWTIPKGNIPPKGSPEEKYLANRLANGIDITPRTLWELMPWTWMIDWFSNIGDFIDLSYNIIGAASGRYCVMHHITNEWRFENLSNLSFTQGSPRAEIKRRVPLATVYPEVHLPFVTGGMASILGNLAVQRWVK